MSIGKKIKELFKNSLSVQLVEIEEKADVENESLLDDVKKILDVNGDGYIKVNDFTTLMKKYLDKNGDGNVSIWEYIGFFFQVRSIAKKLKRG